MEYKEKIKNLLPLLDFVTDYDPGKFAGRLVKRFDYDFLIDQFPKFDPDRAFEKTYRGYFKAIEKWYGLGYGEWKASRDKQATGESMKIISDILEDEFGHKLEKPKDPEAWVLPAVKRRVKLKKEWANANETRRREIMQEIRGISNRLESNGYE